MRKKADSGNQSPGNKKTVVDRSNVKHHAGAAGLSPDQVLIRTVEEKRRILKERAKILAEETIEKETTKDCLEIVEFKISGELYGMESSYIREVCALKDITRLPCTPPVIAGIINVRGQIISVIDIKKFFGLPDKGITELNKVVVIGDDTLGLGILVDEITGVFSIPAAEVQKALPTLTGIRADYLTGVTGERLVLLDAGKILSDKKIVVHEVA